MRATVHNLMKPAKQPFLPGFSRRPARRERGVALLEVLASIAVLALGVLGILVMQIRTLADTQTSVRRAQAVRLIEDLSERLHANPNTLNANVLANYVIAWGPAADPGACAADPGCAPKDLAADQIRAWKQNVAQNLPSGDAMTFLAPSGTQLGVLVSWRQNERSLETDYVDAFNSTTSVSNTDVKCQEGRTCHLQFISATGRCSADALSDASFCPSGVASLPATAQ